MRVLLIEDDGATAIANSGSASVVIIERSVMANNALSGVVANGATLLLGASVVTGNGTGLTTANAGSLFSYRNNDVNGNGNDNVTAATTAALQ